MPKIIFPSNSGGSGSGITIEDEDTLVANNVTTLNFTGADVRAILNGDGSVSIWVPSPTYASHWNTTDGTDSALVVENISRTTANISTPTAEGNPFSTSGWANTAEPATTSSSVVFTTTSSNLVTGFGGNATMAVTVYDADGTTVLTTYTTPSITGNATHTNVGPTITVAIANYQVDSTRFKALPTITVDVGAILTAAGRQGGRYHVLTTQTTDTATDGTGPYSYTQPDVFYDTDPTNPVVTAYTIIQTGGSVVTKYISGVEYYTTGSQFTISATGINNLNNNTTRLAATVSATATNYGVSAFSGSPVTGQAGNAYFTSWTSAFDQANVSFGRIDWAIDQANFRYMGTAGSSTVSARDPWAGTGTQTTSNTSIVVDTFTSSATALFEGFNGETYRQDSGFNSGGTTGNWLSSTDLATAGGFSDGMVYSGQLIVPSQAILTSGGTNTNWTTFAPSAGTQPNYAALTAPSVYYRTFSMADPATDLNNFQMVFSGTFSGANALADLTTETSPGSGEYNLEIIIFKILSPSNSHEGPNNAFPLYISGAAYNAASFDDGTTNGQIRLGSSSANTINCTFGGAYARSGFYMKLIIRDTAIKLSSITVSFN